MLDPAARLSEKVFTDGIEKAPTRDGFGKGVVEAGKKDERVVVLSADLAESTRAEWFKNEFPHRFIEMGVAEQNMATVAAGLATYGKIPFITSYAAFSPGRNYEQIRTTIALNDVPVKVCGMHAGISVGPDGATHQMLEDIAMMRVLPNMAVIVPGDAEEARKATFAATFTGKPAYLRFGRDEEPIFTTAETHFEIGKAYYLWKNETPDVAMIGCGSPLYQALLAAKELSEEGIVVSVLNSHTVKPLDEKTIRALAERVRAVVTVEEHQTAGGLGGAVAELLARYHPLPMRFIGIQNRFGQSGKPSELMKEYQLTTRDIVRAAKEALGGE